MIFDWLKDWRRARVRARPFPEEWLGYLRQNVAYYEHLSEAEQAKLRGDVQVFVAEKKWEGCGGLVMTDEIRVTIAAQACLLVLGLDYGCYDRVLSVLVYPHAYRGTLHEEQGLRDPGRLGEAWYRGPVVLAWDRVLHDGRHPDEGHNVVFHEFAHQLDMLDGVIDGTPPLKDAEQARRWHDVMTAEYQRLVAASELGRATLLDHYGAASEGEFFAVCTECFFDLPVEMRRRHPRLYELFLEFYRQDSAERFLRKAAEEGAT
jgi:Mlc titration factor MtfA (ptsG expression regulator)